MNLTLISGRAWVPFSVFSILNVKNVFLRRHGFTLWGKHASSKVRQSGQYFGSGSNVVPEEEPYRLWRSREISSNATSRFSVSHNIYRMSWHRIFVQAFLILTGWILKTLMSITISWNISRAVGWIAEKFGTNLVWLYHHPHNDRDSQRPQIHILLIVIVQPQIQRLVRQLYFCEVKMLF